MTIRQIVGVLVLALTGGAGCDRSAALSDDPEQLPYWLESATDYSTLGAATQDWPDERPRDGFILLGASKSGWVVHVTRRTGLLLDGPVGPACRDGVPCFDIKAFNLSCDAPEPCFGDIADAGEECKCFGQLPLGRLHEWGVQPVHVATSGIFPLRRGDVTFDIQIRFRDAVFPSEVHQQGQPSVGIYPATDVVLTANGQDRLLLERIDHHHSMIEPGIRVAGWIKLPDHEQLVVLLRVRRPARGQDGHQYGLHPVVAPIKPRKEE